MFVDMARQGRNGAFICEVGRQGLETHEISHFHSHIYRTLNKVTLDDFDITGPQMVLTLKLTSFAWHIYDGRRPSEVSLEACKGALIEHCLGSRQGPVKYKGY
jgi:hypothetical protein